MQRRDCWACGRDRTWEGRAVASGGWFTAPSTAWRSHTQVALLRWLLWSEDPSNARWQPRHQQSSKNVISLTHPNTQIVPCNITFTWFKYNRFSLVDFSGLKSLTVWFCYCSENKHEPTVWIFHTHKNDNKSLSGCV